ncbi:MFS transporter [Litorihabitans aurantiacus]|uniref:MFS transporter n=1 Tax=Litorihabitans aurantiacus TaxID=1930061 RepID=A0AA37XCJ2_9MICO|nr:MFS transporter [Litorihabitans aurantiacus]GMA30166.1 MFS transporter [Litorihabitans aurantiacus]
MTTTAAPTSIVDPRLRWTTIGALAMVLLAAFEAMAVTTIMPAVSRDLDGQALYSVAFSATLAASIVGMVLAGRASDRHGPALPLTTAIGTFLLGLLVAGLAQAMEVFVVGRFLQGLGGGALTVCLYVVVARLYPPALHPRVFGAFAAAWIVPSMVGPFVAGVVADTLSWHWVFLGVAALVLLALAALVPALRAMLGADRAVEGDTDAVVPADADADAAPSTPGRRRVGAGVAVALAVAVTAGLLILGTSAELVPPPWTWAPAGAAVVVVLVAARPLLPRGTLLAAPGLPATVLIRGTIAAAYFGTEVYLPLMLQTSYGLSSSGAGLILTVGALAWATGSNLQARLVRVPPGRILQVGAGMVLAGVGIQIATAAFDLGPWVAGGGWLVAGLGMGTSYPRITTLVLARSTRADQGANSSALSISDAIGGAAATAVAGLVLGALAGVGGTRQFLGGFAVALTAAVCSVLVAARAGRSATTTAQQAAGAPGETPGASPTSSDA